MSLSVPLFSLDIYIYIHHSLKESEDGQLLTIKKFNKKIKTFRVSRPSSVTWKIELIKSTLNKITEQNKTQNTIQRYELRNRRDYNNTKTRISDANIPN